MRKIVLIALLCIAVAATGIIFWARHSAPAKIDVSRNGSSTSTGSAGAPPEVIDQTFNENTASYVVQVQYPQLRGLVNGGIQAKINDAIKSAVYDQIASFHEENASSSAVGMSGQSTLTVDYTVALITSSFFSGMIAYSDYSAGAAHPYNYIVTVNYNLKTGNALTLNQALQEMHPSTGYFARIGQYVRKDLEDQFGSNAEEADLINTGAAPTLQNYKYFTLDRRGLNILFNPYQVAPGSAGIPKVSIPYDGKTLNAEATSTILWWLK